MLAFVKASEEVGAAVTVRQWGAPTPDTDISALTDVAGSAARGGIAGGNAAAEEPLA